MDSYSPYEPPHSHPGTTPSNTTGTAATSVTESITNPTNMSSLLAEEYTMNPSTPLPSFLEMNLVDGTAESGRRALGQCLDAIVARCEAAMRRTMPGHGASLSAGAGVAVSQQSLQTSTILAWKLRLATIISHACKRYGAEIVLLITYAVERYSMQKSSALAEESVYGMKRCRARYERDDDGNGGGRGAGAFSLRLSALTERDKVRCALVAALLPYIKERLGSYYKKNKDSHNAITTSSTDNDRSTPSISRIRSKIETIFINIYPYLHMTSEGASLAYQFLFLAGMTGYYSPSMHALGVLARRVTRADLQEAEQAQRQAQLQQQQNQRQLAAKSTAGIGNGNSGRTTTSSGSKSKVRTALMAGIQSGKVDGAVRAIQTAIIVGGSSMLLSAWVAHFCQELRERRRRWITGEDDARQRSAAGGNMAQTGRPATTYSNAGPSNGNGNVWSPQSFTIPPPYPPKLLDESESEVIRKGVPTDKSLCPICHRTRVNPAASTSGYVFCYRCIVMHIRTNGETCPLTGMHCPESRVIRLFEPTAGAGHQEPQDGQRAGQSTSS